jgi:hypothetical protein
MNEPVARHVDTAWQQRAVCGVLLLLGISGCSAAETIKVETVTSTITLRDWEPEGGTRSMIGLTFGGAKVLAVVQTDPMQESVAAFLARMRAAGKQH